MDDYEEIIKEMLSEYFTVCGDVFILQSTASVLAMVQGIIPQQPIDEHNVFSVLKSMGFDYKLHTVYEEDKDGNDTAVVLYRLFMWKLYPISNS